MKNRMTARLNSDLINSHTMYSTVLTTRGASQPGIEPQNRSESTAARVCALNCVREVGA